MRILLAEDDSVLADGLTRSLRQSGYAIDCVKNGQDADTALSTQEFDLLILDLGLPKMLRLKESRKTPFFNGALECRLFRFDMVAGFNRREEAKPKQD